MKQILQDLRKGTTYLAEVPAPKATAGSLLIASRTTLISVGTERMLVDFGRSSLLQKARQQPEKVKMVLEKIGTDGLLTTIDAVRSKLAQPIALGYCNAGVVLETGSGVEGFKPGDRVVSNGPHADVVRVPQNLCARIPDGVDDESAAFTVVGAIGLQGIRLIAPTLGEAVVVSGVGLIGLLTVQLLVAQGSRVLTIDFDADKLDLARSFGAETCNLGKGEDPVAAGLAFSRGRGVDAVVITASTSSSEPVSQAAQMCRKRGRIVLVGVTGLELNRSEFYEKELSFQVSCSYGPGRYDPDYEEAGNDYPVGFVRWTEQRNFEAILDMMASGRLDVKPLISHRIPFEEAPSAYDMLTTDSSVRGVLLGYSATADEDRLAPSVVLSPEPRVYQAAKPVCGFIGAGNYASRMLLPAFKVAGAQFKTIVTSGGLSGVIHGAAAGFEDASTDVDAMLADPEINTVAVVTRHNSHAALTCRVLAAGKHVFVEKPLALDSGELERVRAAHTAGSAQLMVGYNRRFAPHVVEMKRLLAPVREPKSFVMTMNAGAIPANHWTQDLAIGGGRVLGEACHLIDLMRHLADSPIVSMQARCMGNTLSGGVADDKAAIILGFADGSFGTINYLANGSARFPKERIEVFCAGGILQLDNFRKLRGFGWRGFHAKGSMRQDKGQDACVAAFLSGIENGTGSPIPADQIFEVAKASIDIAEMLRAQ